jgi:hypothetical protein
VSQTVQRTTYTLVAPFEFAGEMIAELHFRKPMAKDFREVPIEMKSVGDLLNLAGSLCGQPPAVIDRLSFEDLQGVSALVSGFMLTGPATGNGGSQ